MDINNLVLVWEYLCAVPYNFNEGKEFTVHETACQRINFAGNGKTLKILTARYPLESGMH